MNDIVKNVQLVTYKLNVDPKAKPMKQLARKYRLDVEEKIKVEVDKLLNAGFIKEKIGRASCRERV